MNLVNIFQSLLYSMRLYKLMVGICLLLGTTLFFTACKKNLDQKPAKQTVIPSTLADLQALLDNNQLVNQQGSPAALAELVSGNTYTKTATWQSFLSSLPDLALSYIWDAEAAYQPAWTGVYQGPIKYANLVLDQLDKVNKDQPDSVYDRIKGSALFYRAFAFLELAQVYCKPYSSTAGSDLGIVLRTTSAVEAPSTRSTVEQTYSQIIGDLQQAAELLPEVAAFTTRPTKAAVYGTLARAYLNMRDYVNAKRFADSTLARNNNLLNYNTLVPGVRPFFTDNPEIIFYNKTSAGSLLTRPRGIIDSILFRSYDVNDLRKTIFFIQNTGADVGTYSFRGSYGTSATDVFDGITTAEMYLIRAECNARIGNTSEAMESLNTLMHDRWNNNEPWVPITAIDADDAKDKVLVERRKELIYRGQQWSDLRRLNLEGENITLSRVIDGVTYTLPPNDLRWVLLIPRTVIQLSGIPQNQRN